MPVEKRHQGLQAVRGIAAMMVFLHHMPWLTKIVTGESFPALVRLNLGDAGVFVFFVLSGYLMTYKVTASPLKFLRDRARRILPGLWLALLVGYGMVWWLYGSFNPHVAPFFLYPVGKSEGFGVPYWTLHFEVAFYLLVFFATLLSPRPLLAIVACLAISYAFAPRPYVWRQVAYPNWPHLLFNVYSLLFLVGVLIGRLPRPRSGWFGLALAIVGAFLFWTVTASSATLPILRQAIAAGLVVAGALTWHPRRLFGRALIHLGDASYGIYLLHIGFGLVIAGELAGTAAADAPYFAAMALVAVPTLTLAYGFGMLEFSMQRQLKSLLDGSSRVHGVTPINVPASSTMMSNRSAW